jgi:hypothetical protein
MDAPTFVASLTCFRPICPPARIRKGMSNRSRDLHARSRHRPGSDLPCDRSRTANAPERSTRGRTSEQLEAASAMRWESRHCNHAGHARLSHIGRGSPVHIKFLLRGPRVVDEVAEPKACTCRATATLGTMRHDHRFDHDSGYWSANLAMKFAQWPIPGIPGGTWSGGSSGSEDWLTRGKRGTDHGSRPSVI